MLGLNDESKMVKKNYKWLKEYVLGCKLSVCTTQEAAKNIFL